MQVGSHDGARPAVDYRWARRMSPGPPVGERQIVPLRPDLGVQAARARMLGPFDLADQKGASAHALRYEGDIEGCPIRSGTPPGPGPAPGPVEVPPPGELGRHGDPLEGNLPIARHKVDGAASREGLE